MKIIGLDISLTSTGVSDGRWVDVIRPPAGLRGPRRQRYIWHAIRDHAADADLVVAEAGAPNYSGPRNHEELAGMRQITFYELEPLEIPVAKIPPSVRAKYATGRGNAGKEDVLREVQWRYGVICEGPGKFDQADALTLAGMGWHWLGFPLAAPPEGFSLNGDWPDEITAESLRSRSMAEYRPSNP